MNFGNSFKNNSNEVFIESDALDLGHKEAETILTHIFGDHNLLGSQLRFHFCVLISILGENRVLANANEADSSRVTRAQNRFQKVLYVV